MEQVSKPSSTTQGTERKSRVILSPHKRKRDAVEGKKLNMPETLVSGVPAGRCPTVLPPCCRIHWVDLDLHFGLPREPIACTSPMFVGCGRLRRSWIWADRVDRRHHLVPPCAYQTYPRCRRVSTENRLNGQFGQVGKAVFLNAGR